MAIFWYLAILTVVELGVVFLPFGKLHHRPLLVRARGWPRRRWWRCTSCTCKFETRTLGLIAVTPLAIATLLVFVLLPDGFAVQSQDRREEAGGRGAGEALTPAGRGAERARWRRAQCWRACIRRGATALRLRCPRCGRAPLFRGWFAMNVVCAVCDLRFERAQGYWVGAIYVNYARHGGDRGRRVLPAREWPRTVDHRAAGAVGAVRACVFPLWFFRYSREPVAGPGVRAQSGRRMTRAESCSRRWGC